MAKTAKKTTKTTKTTAKATRKKTTAAVRTTPEPKHTEAYEAALEEYGSALEQMRAGRFQEALEAFRKLVAENVEESELADRARTYASICERRLAPQNDEPGTAEQRFHRAVFLANLGRLDEAIALYDGLLKSEPANTAFLYARASAHALDGNAEAAVADLRQAVATEPSLRFQAINDPDFENIRDDAAFIDVIEPTPAGA